MTSSIPTGMLRNFIITCQGTKYVSGTNVSGHKRTRLCPDTFVPRHDCDHAILTCWNTNVSGHKRVWTQFVSGHKRV